MAIGNTIGRNIIRQAGYGGEMQDWDEYALWLGQPHRLRLWREMVSNSMVVMKDFLVYCRQEMKDRIDGEGEVESIAESKGEGRQLVETVMDVRNSTDDDSAGHEAGESTQVNSMYIENEQARGMEAVVNVEQLRQMIDEWKQLCVLCKIQGRASRGHQH